MSVPSTRRLLVAGSLAFAFSGAIGPLYGLAIPIYREAWGAGGGGALLGLHGAGALTAVVAGIFGLPHLTLRLALALLAAGMAISATGLGWGAAFVGAFVIGLGFGLSAAVINRRFLSEFGERGPAMVGLVNAIFGIGAIAAPLVLVASGERLGPIYLGLALLHLALIPVVQPSGRQARAQGLPDLRQPRLLILGFVHVSVIVEVALFGLGPTALTDLGLASDTVAWLTSGFFATFLAGRLALYWLTRILRGEQIYALGMAGGAAALTLAILGLPGIGFVLAGAAIGVQFPTFYLWASDILGDDPRMGSAVLAASISAAITGPALLAPVLGGLGTSFLFPILAVLLATNCLVFLLVLPWARQRGAGVQPVAGGGT